MARPLPTTCILAFRAPVVKAEDVYVPVLVHGDWYGLQLPCTVAAALGSALVKASAPAPRLSGRPPAPRQSDTFAPITKPGGRLL